MINIVVGRKTFMIQYKIKKQGIDNYKHTITRTIPRLTLKDKKGKGDFRGLD